MLTSEEALWKLFETTGSVEAYLEYTKDKEKFVSREENSFGNSRDGGNSDERG